MVCNTPHVKSSLGKLLEGAPDVTACAWIRVVTKKKLVPGVMLTDALGRFENG